MSKLNALAGLIGNYGDSDEDSDDGGGSKVIGSARRAELPVQGYPTAIDSQSVPDSSAAIHPAPIPHCPWSACYDENSGFTYYWNQQTNAVTWEAPPEYLLALKLAQQQLNVSGSTEVSAEEWQLYQQALAEKQNTQGKVAPKPVIAAKPPKKPNIVDKNAKTASKRRMSYEEEKIELITSYHNSDSESNDEAESPVKPPVPVNPPKPPKIQTQAKRPKIAKPKEFGPPLPRNQNYTMPIGPEIPPEFLVDTPKEKVMVPVPEEVKKPKPPDNDDSQDENILLTKLKDKAKLLEKLGGEIPVDLQKIIQDGINSTSNSPKVSEAKDSQSSIDIDDLLQEIEKKELPNVAKNSKVDMFSNGARVNDGSIHNSPKSNGIATPPKDEVKPLFPSSKNIGDVPTASLFPSTAIVQENDVERPIKDNPLVSEKKGVNLYLANASEVIEKTSRKKLRISNSVLPVKKPEVPSYTTKYAQSIDGLSGERTGLGFSKDDEEESTPKNAISYGNGLLFTKGETLNEDKKEDDLDDMTELLELKLKFLCQLQPTPVSPVQEMMIQMQTLAAAFRAGALSARYWRGVAAGAGAALRRHEAGAAPAGWTCAFLRSEGRYRYVREADGLVQWEYPAVANMDMEICTTPPHPGTEHKEEAAPPPLPPPPAAPRTPPPPAWADPPPPGCDDATPPLPPEPKQEIGDELTSFYNDIAELEKQAPPTPPAAADSPEPPLPPAIPPLPRADREKSREREKDREKEGKVKKKSKVKISSSIGMKQKSVSSLVAKWQQVADEINSD